MLWIESVSILLGLLLIVVSLFGAMYGIIMLSVSANGRVAGVFELDSYVCT